MRVWLDAHLPPNLAGWLAEHFHLEAVAVRDLGLRDANDLVIFAAAREAGAVVLSKDSDFVRLQDRCGPPPQVLWLTFGNTSNARLRAILEHLLPEALEHLRRGEALVEIGEAGSPGPAKSP